MSFSLKNDEEKKGLLKIDLYLTTGTYFLTFAIREGEKILHDQLKQVPLIFFCRPWFANDCSLMMEFFQRAGGLCPGQVEII